MDKSSKAATETTEDRKNEIVISLNNAIMALEDAGLKKKASTPDPNPRLSHEDCGLTRTKQDMHGAGTIGSGKRERVKGRATGLTDIGQAVENRILDKDREGTWN